MTVIWGGTWQRGAEPEGGRGVAPVGQVGGVLSDPRRRLRRERRSPRFDEPPPPPPRQSNRLLQLDATAPRTGTHSSSVAPSSARRGPATASPWQRARHAHSPSERDDAHMTHLDGDFAAVTRRGGGATSPVVHCAPHTTRHRSLDGVLARPRPTSSSVMPRAATSSSDTQQSRCSSAYQRQGPRHLVPGSTASALSATTSVPSPQYAGSDCVVSTSVRVRFGSIRFG